MKTYSIAAILLLAAVNAQANFNVGIISLDIYETAFSSNPPYGPGAAAIGNSEDIWNSIDLFGNLSAQGLKNTDGTTTAVGFTIGNGSGGGSGGDDSGIYDLLFDTQSSFPNVPNQLDQITGLTPNFQYDLFLYSADNRSGISVNGIVFSSPIDTGPYDSLIAGVNYSEHIVTSDGAGNLNMIGVIDATFASGFGAFQLEAIPEPSTLALAALGASLLVAARPKKPLL